MQEVTAYRSDSGDLFHSPDAAISEDLKNIISTANTTLPTQLAFRIIDNRDEVRRVLDQLR